MESYWNGQLYIIANICIGDYPVHKDQLYSSNDLEMSYKGKNYYYTIILIFTHFILYLGQNKNSELFHLESGIKLLEKILPTALANGTSPYGITAHLGAMNHFGSYNMPPPGPYYLPSYPHMEYNSVFSQNGGSRDFSLHDYEGLLLSDTRTDASDGDTSLHDDKAPSQVSTVVTTPVSVPQDVSTETCAPSQVVSDNFGYFVSLLISTGQC